MRKKFAIALLAIYLSLFVVIPFINISEYEFVNYMGTPDDYKKNTNMEQATYYDTIDYLDWYSVWFNSNIDSSYKVEWSFSGANTYVGINVYAMDDYNYGLWSSASTASVYTLSDGSFYYDSCSYDDPSYFVPPYSDIWYFVFYNQDPDAQSSYVAMSVSASKAEASIYSFSYTRYDSDSDGYYDGVTATFDPDIEEGTEGDVTVAIDLTSDTDDSTIHSVTDTYSLNGLSRSSYTLDLGSVTYLDDYYLFAKVYHSSTFLYDDSTSSEVFVLMQPGYGFSSTTQETSETTTTEPETSVTSEVPTKYLTVTSPMSGTSWTTATTQSIIWTSSGTTSNVDIFLYKSFDTENPDTFIGWITQGASNSGTFAWRIPADLDSGNDYWIEISDSNDSDIYDFSETFELTKSSSSEPPESLTQEESEKIIITNPTPVSTWRMGANYVITWSYIEGMVTIELWKGNSFANQLSDGVDGTKNFEWVIPDNLVESDDYQIKIISNDHPSIWGISSDFRIIPSNEDTTTNRGVEPILKTPSFTILVLLSSIFCYTLYIHKKRRRNS